MFSTNTLNQQMFNVIIGLFHIKFRWSKVITQSTKTLEVKFIMKKSIFIFILTVLIITQSEIDWGFFVPILSFIFVLPCVKILLLTFGVTSSRFAF